MGIFILGKMFVIAACACARVCVCVCVRGHGFHMCKRIDASISQGLGFLKSKQTGSHSTPNVHNNKAILFYSYDTNER